MLPWLSSHLVIKNYAILLHRMFIYLSKSEQNSSLEKQNHRYFIAVSILIALHFFGFLGMKLAWMNEWLQQLSPFESFASLTPLNLIVTAVLLFSFHQTWNSASLLFMVLASVAGFLAEWIGVHTGWIFGDYWYGSTLGWKLDEIPLLIGINWLILTYCTGVVLHQTALPNYLKALLGASIMVSLDWFIEPVAIQYDFWEWAGGVIPLSNYIGWFVLAFLLSLCFHYLSFNKKNVLAMPVLIAQCLFFIAHSLFL